ncbi:MAG: hypothetical protein O2897_04195 [bacterium]|nr:hypothetical protein [bacterium]
MVHNTNIRQPNIATSLLKGELLKHDETQMGTTPSHSINFTQQYGDEFLPHFQFTPRSIVDPEIDSHQQLFSIKDDEISEIKNAKVFEKKLNEQFKAKAEHLIPTVEILWSKLAEEDRTLFAYNNIIGQRIEKFFDEAIKWLENNSINPEEDSKCRNAINKAYGDAFKNRQVNFDKANTDTYWSYCHHSMFVGVFNKIRDALAKDDPKRLYIQKQIDFLYTTQYTVSGFVDENDAERSLDLRAIDAQSRHTVSMTESSEKSNKISYYILQIPETAKRNAGRFAYRDNDNYYFEDNNEIMSPKDIKLLKEKYSSEIVLRPFIGNEKPRANFRYDWNKNNMIDSEHISTSWWGKCDTRATIQTFLADLRDCKEVKEFNSTTQNTLTLTRADLLEGLAALISFDCQYIPVHDKRRKMVNLDHYESGGIRYDDDFDKFFIDTGTYSLELLMRVDNISTLADTTVSAPLEKVFKQKLPDEKLESFSINEEVVHEEGNVFYIDATTRKFSAKTEGKTFNESGHIIDLKTSFEIDPSKTSTEPILIGSSIQNVNDRTLLRTYYNPKTRIEEVVAKFNYSQAKNGYFATEKISRDLGSIKSILIGRQLKEDNDIGNKLALATSAVRTGTKIAADSDPGDHVWNGDVFGLNIVSEYKSPDGKWERLAIKSDATYGYNKKTTLINKHDETGKIVDSCEVEAGIDFFWKHNPVIAPLIYQKGILYANKSLLERGVLNLDEGKIASLGALQDLYDFVYMAFLTKKHKPITYSINHKGQRLVYDTEEKWQTDVKRLTIA